MIKAGDKVKFNEETKKLYLSWINAPDHKGRHIFCNALLNAGGVDSEFTVRAVSKIHSNDEETFEIILNEMPGWYFSANEFEEKKEEPVKAKSVEAKEMKHTKTLTEAYLELCEKYNKQKEINKDLVDEIDQKDRIIRAFDEDSANLESDIQELKEILKKLLNLKDENYNNVLERYASSELLEEAREYIDE
jgi:DNA repair exonuclease SbcCD nuclease subunit